MTWHGPGQLVGYPLIRMPDPIDVMDYVHRLEAAIMRVCAVFGIVTERQEERTGVWVPADDRGPNRKIAAIGVRIARGVTMHGFALNCNNDLDWSAVTPPQSTASMRWREPCDLNSQANRSASA